uniref:C2H2-type domain-containing protein n=1 Tax=Anopheles coluzzii TaxID=1518534 RepID=A0A6E8VM44_ANOCL
MWEKCRLCLKKIGARKGASITDDEFGAMLSRVFTFPVAVTESVLLVNVCAKCALMVRNFNAFSEAVEANQNVLLSELMVEEKGRELDDEKVKHTQVISSRELTVEPKGREVEDVKHGHSLTKPVLDQEYETNEKKPVEKLADDDDGTASMLPIEDMEVLLKEQLDDDFSSDDNNSTTHTDDKTPNSRSKKPDLHENDRIIMEFLALDRHIKQHQGIETIEKLDCPHCGKQLNGKYNLQKHVRCMHVEAGKSYRCEVCGHFSPNSVALENHKKRVHTGEHFECGECGKRFKQKIYLTEHVAALHTRKPLYACEFCEATFKSRANYYTHRKTRHRAEWEALREERKQGEGKRLFAAADVITGVV